MFGIVEVGEDDPLAAQKETVRRKKGRKGMGAHRTGILRELVNTQKRIRKHGCMRR